MPAAKSWRLVFREHGVANQSLYIYVSEVVFYDASSNNVTPLISGVSAISRWDTQFSAGNSIDGNLNTAWYSSESSPMWLRYDFSVAVDIGSFTLRNFVSTTSSPYWTDLQFLTEFGDWLTVSSHWRNIWSAYETKTFSVPTARQASKYWSIQAINEQFAPAVGGIALRESIGGIDLLQSATLTTSSSASAPSVLIDGNFTTIWTSNSITGSFWAMADCGSSKSVTVAEYDRGISGSQPSLLMVLTSDDGLDWAVRHVSRNAGLTMPTSSKLVLLLDTDTTSSVNVSCSLSFIPANGDAIYSINKVNPVYDYYRHGDGYISGVVTINGQPAERVVHLFDMDFSAVIRSVVSDPTTGAYDFRPIDRSRDYIVMSRDYKAVYNAVVADRVRPEPIQ